MTRRAPLLLGCTLAACQATLSPTTTELRDRLAALAGDAMPRRVCIAYAELDGSRTAEVAATEILHAASTMKLAVMIELFRRADRGECRLEQTVALHNGFASIVDGSRYALDPNDDSDGDLFAHLGEPISLRELCEHMIRNSSNLATNLLIDELGAARVQTTIEELGAASGMKVLRGVEDGPAFRAGLNNLTTARDLCSLLLAIARGRAASRSSCRTMLDILIGQEFRDMIPAGLPPGTVVANKTGTITRIHHDAAIVDPFGARPWVLVVLTAGYDDEREASRIGARIAHLVHAAR